MSTDVLLAQEVLGAVAVVGVDVEDRDPTPAPPQRIFAARAKSANTQKPDDRSRWAWCLAPAKLTAVRARPASSSSSAEQGPAGHPAGEDPEVGPRAGPLVRQAVHDDGVHVVRIVDQLEGRRPGQQVGLDLTAP